MNERIKELYQQAEKSVQFLSNSSESKQRIVIEKFAELIVDECGEVAFCNSHVSGLALKELFKKHFEIK